MGTLCKDRYPYQVGGQYNFKMYMAPGADYATCGPFWQFDPWYGVWKTAGQATKGIRERIWYDTGWQSTSWCKHWKYSIDPSASEPKSLDPYPLCTWRDIYSVGSDLGIFRPYSIADGGWELPEIRIPSSEDLIPYHAAAWNYFKNAGIDKQLDLSVSMTESWGWLDYARELTNKKISLLKKLASTRLFYAFGLAPLAGDLLGIYKAACEVPKRIQFLKDNLGKPVKMYYSSKIPGFCGTQNMFPNTRWGNYGASGKQKYRANMELVYELEPNGLNESTLAWECWKRGLGLSNPATFIWEKIPFSFLIDYLIGLGDLFEKLGETPIFSVLNPIKQSYSVKLKQSFQYGVNWQTRTNNGVKWASKIEFEYYERDTLPSEAGLPLPTINSPGVTQLINSLALLIGVQPSKKTRS